MTFSKRNIYFISDAHLGSWAFKDARSHEKRLVAFLDSIKDKAEAIYMLGDMFDFWHEYRYVVPRGFTRFLGKLSELSDRGIELHLLVGNHDLWMKDYLNKECGVIIHKEKLLRVSLHDKHFVLAHGDGLDKSDYGYRVLRFLFHNKVCQLLFATIHPRWAIKLGYSWARHSRLKHEKQEGIVLPEDKDDTLAFARKYATVHKETDYFIIGHRHVDQICPLPNGGKFMVLGDWIEKFTVAVFDGKNLETTHFKQ